MFCAIKKYTFNVYIIPYVLSSVKAVFAVLAVTALKRSPMYKFLVPPQRQWPRRNFVWYAATQIGSFALLWYACGAKCYRLTLP